MELSVSINGLSDVLAEIDLQNKYVKDVYDIINDETFFAVMNSAVTEAPVRTGYLRRSAYHEAHMYNYNFTIAAGFFANYAGYVDESHRSNAGFFTENINIAINNINRRIDKL